MYTLNNNYTRKTTPSILSSIILNNFFRHPNKPFKYNQVQ